MKKTRRDIAEVNRRKDEGARYYDEGRGLDQLKAEYGRSALYWDYEAGYLEAAGVIENHDPETGDYEYC